MKLYVTYGFFITLGGAILTLALFALGFHSDNIAVGQKLGWIGVLIMIAGIAFGMREWRREVGKGTMGYGRALGTGVLISLWAALFSAIFNFIYFKFINPGFSEAIVQFQLSEMAKKDLPANAIDKAEGVIRFFSSAPMMTLMGVLSGIVFGVVLSLILAAIFKSKSTDSAPAAPPSVQA